jgi:hypothetical protein
MFDNQRKCFAENVKLLLTWISDQQALGDNVNSVLIRQKAKNIFSNLKAGLY